MIGLHDWMWRIYRMIWDGNLDYCYRQLQVKIDMERRNFNACVHQVLEPDIDDVPITMRGLLELIEAAIALHACCGVERYWTLGIGTPGHPVVIEELQNEWNEDQDTNDVPISRAVQDAMRQKWKEITAVRSPDDL